MKKSIKIINVYGNSDKKAHALQSWEYVKKLITRNFGYANYVKLT